MRTFDYTISPSFAATYNSIPFELPHMEGVSIQISTTSASTAAGTVKLQCSNNALLDNQGVNAPYVDPNAVWIDVAGSTNTISSGANSYMYNVAGVYYKWCRLVYTSSSGSGTALLVAHGKGVQS